MPNQIKTILVLPRLSAEAKEPNLGEVCISITNPRQSPAQLAAWHQILRLGFHDVDYPVGDFKAMTRKQAYALLEFVHTYKENSITVHCEWGASRSVAAGLFISAWLNQKLSLEPLTPNPWVTLMLCQAGWRKALLWRDWRLFWVSITGPLFFYNRALSTYTGN